MANEQNNPQRNQQTSKGKNPQQGGQNKPGQQQQGGQGKPGEQHQGGQPEAGPGRPGVSTAARVASTANEPSNIDFLRMAARRIGGLSFFL